MKISESKITKLVNAIRAYRGITTPLESGPVKWIISERPTKSIDVVRWLRKCGRRQQQIVGDMTAIDGFKDVNQFKNWIDETFRKEQP